MNFTHSLDAFLSNEINEFDFYRKCVSFQIQKPTEIIDIKGDINGFSSDGTITLIDIEWPNDYIHDKKKDYDDDDDDIVYSLEFHIKSILSIKFDDLSKTNEIFDIIKYKTIQQILHFINLPELNIKNRKKLLNIKNNQNNIDISEVKDIISKINALNINKNDKNLIKKLKNWIFNNNTSNNDIYLKTNVYNVDDLINLLKSYQKMWINYISSINLNDDDDDNKAADKQYSTYITWDNSDIKYKNQNDIILNRARNIYLKSLWPHCFHGPYYKPLSSNPDWKCKKCNRISSGSSLIKTPSVCSDNIALTTDMKSKESVQSALCIIPPSSVWPQIQKIRSKHDPAYIRWMPHLNIFFPFIEDKYFAQIAEFLLNEIINKNKISSFNINLQKFGVFQKVQDQLDGKKGTTNKKRSGYKKKGKSAANTEKLETMFLNPDSASLSKLRNIFKHLKKHWVKCAAKHGDGVFNPHLTVGKFKLNEMKYNLNKFNNKYVNKISFKCSSIYLISRKGNEPFEIRYKIPFIDSNTIADGDNDNVNRLITYYKIKRTSFTYEICNKCIKKEERNVLNKEMEKIKKIKAKKKEQRKKREENDNKKLLVPEIREKAPQLPIDLCIKISSRSGEDAQWSDEYKGSGYELSENNRKVLRSGSGGSCIRAAEPLYRGEITIFEYEMYIHYSMNFGGIISSEQTDLNNLTGKSTTTHLYGLDWSKDYGYCGKGRVKLSWTKVAFADDKLFKLRIIADWEVEPCKLTFFYNDEKLDGTIELPVLDTQYNWYPCVCVYDPKRYCTIKYIDD